MPYTEIKKLIKEHKNNNDWKTIAIGISKIEDQESLPNDILGEQAFAYSQYAKLLEKEKAPKEEIAEAWRCAEAIYFKVLKTELQDTKLYLILLKGLAYVCYNNFQNKSINVLAPHLNKEKRDILINKIRYKNFAAFLYSKIIKSDPTCIKSFYRYGKLLKESSNLYRLETKYITDGIKTVKASYSRFLQEKSIEELFPKEEINTYIDSLPEKNKNIAYLGANHLLKAIRLYESLIDEKEQQRTRKEYEKAMYNYVVMCCDEKRDADKYTYKLNHSLAETFLNKIMLIENFKNYWKENELKEAALVPPSKRAVDIQFFHHTKGKYHMILRKGYEFQYTPDERNCEEFKQALHHRKMACMAEIYQREDRGERRSWNKAYFEDFIVDYLYYIERGQVFDKNKERALSYFKKGADKILKHYNKFYNKETRTEREKEVAVAFQKLYQEKQR